MSASSFIFTVFRPANTPFISIRIPNAMRRISNQPARISIRMGKNTVWKMPKATTLVVHAKADDMKTDPSGNSGDRIACGAVTK